MYESHSKFALLTAPWLGTVHIATTVWQSMRFPNMQEQRIAYSMFLTIPSPAGGLSPRMTLWRGRTPGGCVDYSPFPQGCFLRLVSRGESHKHLGAGRQHIPEPVTLVAFGLGVGAGSSAEKSEGAEWHSLRTPQQRHEQSGKT